MLFTIAEGTSITPKKITLKQRFQQFQQQYSSDAPVGVESRHNTHHTWVSTFDTKGISTDWFQSGKRASVSIPRDCRHRVGTQHMISSFSFRFMLTGGFTTHKSQQRQCLTCIEVRWVWWLCTYDEAETFHERVLFAYVGTLSCVLCGVQTHEWLHDFVGIGKIQCWQGVDLALRRASFVIHLVLFTHILKTILCY